nr:mucin-1-like [Anas platyrhynchos]
MEAEANTSPSGSTAPNSSSSGHPELVPTPTSPAAPTESPAPITAPAPSPSNASATGPSTAPATGPSTAPATSHITAPTPGPSTAPIIGPSLGAGPPENPPSKTNPGLVVVICLFVAVLVGAAALLLVRLCRCRTPGFQRLDEVPMSKVSEGFPFAHRPPR